jgi:5-methylcytosine-specific restriction endonuclease McrA
MAYVYPFKDAGEDLKQAVWQKGKPIQQGDKSWDSSEWRWDICGTVMRYSEHGNRDSEHGWEIDHIIPNSKGGTDGLDNYQPLNWKNNSAKGDTYPWSCP